MPRKLSCLLISFIYLIFPSFSYAADDWDFEIEPYVLFSSISGDASIGRVTGAPVDVGFGDILDNLKLGAMGHFEGHHDGGWGFSLDYGFMKLGSEVTSANGGVTNVHVRQSVLEGLLIRRYKLSDGLLDFSVGARWWNNDLDLTIDPAIHPGTIDTSVDENWFDFVMGIRWYNNINEKLRFMLRGDVGGIGLQSDFTATLASGIQFKASENWIVDLQYKATWVDYKNGDELEIGMPGYFAYDTVTHGPLLGIIYTF